MIIEVYAENSGYFRIKHPDGTEKILGALHLGQMVYVDKYGKYKYNKEVPKDYWKKHDFLYSKGWKKYWHYLTDWYKGDDYDDRISGFDMETALNKENYYE